MAETNRARLKQWIESGEVRLHPLAFPQRELWEASPVPPADTSNNIRAFINVRGSLAPGACEAALQKVVDRQEVLRLSFLPGQERPLQVIRREGKAELQFRELSSSNNQPVEVEELVREISSKPFDLVKGPLYRTEVIRRAADDHVLVFAIHHAIADGWTLGVFVQDLFAAYVQGLMGVRSALPPVALSYSAWGEAERAFWKPAELDRRMSFWRQRLAGTSRLWSAPAGGDLERFVSRVPAEVGRTVRAIARRSGATLFTTLLTVFQITLSKWTGSEDILVGTPVANRSKQAVRETMGYFSGIVPLRGRIDGAKPFSECLREVHQATLDSFANAIPFAELVKALGGVESPGRNPVFEVRFALQNHPLPDVEVPGLSLQLRMRSTGTARFELGCEINEEGDALEVAWLFRRNRFSTDDIQNLSRLYLDGLTDICRSPEIRASNLLCAV
jgi:hypothetical protein